MMVKIEYDLEHGIENQWKRWIVFAEKIVFLYEQHIFSSSELISHFSLIYDKFLIVTILLGLALTSDVHTNVCLYA